MPNLFGHCRGRVSSAQPKIRISRAQISCFLPGRLIFYFACFRFRDAACGGYRKFGHELRASAAPRLRPAAPIRAQIQHSIFRITKSGRGLRRTCERSFGRELRAFTSYRSNREYKPKHAQQINLITGQFHRSRSRPQPRPVDGCNLVRLCRSIARLHAFLATEIKLLSRRQLQ